MKTKMQSLDSIKKAQKELREFIINSPGNILEEEEDLIWEDRKISDEIKSVENSRKLIPRIDLS